MWMCVALYIQAETPELQQRMCAVARYYDISSKQIVQTFLASTIKNRQSHTSTFIAICMNIYITVLQMHGISVW